MYNIVLNFKLTMAPVRTKSSYSSSHITSDIEVMKRWSKRVTPKRARRDGRISTVLFRHRCFWLSRRSLRARKLNYRTTPEESVGVEGDKKVNCEIYQLHIHYSEIHTTDAQTTDPLASSLLVPAARLLGPTEGLHLTCTEPTQKSA